MFVVSVTIIVKPQFVAQFIEATLENARNTRVEPGNVRFERPASRGGFEPLPVV